MAMHYAPQMAEQGWQPVSAMADDDVAMHVFRMTNERGDILHAALAISRVAEGDLLVHLQIARVGG